MPIFIKPGFWRKGRKPFVGELDLNSISGGGTASYKVFSATLTQQGGLPLVVTVIENTLGENPTFTRVGTSTYRMTITQPLFVKETTEVYVGVTGKTRVTTFSDPTNNTTTSILLGFSNTTAAGTNADNVLLNTPLEIRVYEASLGTITASHTISANITVPTGSTPGDPLCSSDLNKTLTTQSYTGAVISWEHSTDGVNFTTVAGQTSTNYTISGLPQKQEGANYFRSKIGTAYSNVITVYYDADC